ncbi:hypothetical protein [Nonomuraea cavernae]|uniref:Uncharacterized protein n=1 Tax=Nonomuraea cavernae TaxID=2045107 RepID=A0A917YR32_9ACTN|nr:hypothetical protein [Nonomuraea cavernae]MCA2184671.1 hypothetical protein [Nonomuraea cavernae]GGO63107.1 hypothetical protein GCM10012289_09260 [Nonomuraea cavernae]
MSANPVDDQISAAAEHTERIVSAIFASAAAPVIDPVGWVSSVTKDFLAAYLRCRRRCGHLQSPQPVFGTPQQMGVMRCRACFLSYFGEAEAFSTCDRCAATGDGLGGTAVTAGPILLVLMLCEACRTATLAEQE